jgi:dihydroflavonol-4-reductase
MKVAITGATGHLGGLIVRELHNRQHTIKALARSPDDYRGRRGAVSLSNRLLLPPTSIPIEFVKGDLSDVPVLERLMYSCDALIHCAAIISIDGGMKGLVHHTNVVGTRNVMEAAKAAGIKRVVHISSIHAYQQKPMHEVLDESRVKASHKAFAYDRSKKEGQEIALSYANEMEVLVLNPTSVIGPFDFKPSKLGQAIINMVSGKLPFVFKGGFDFCDGRDIAHAAVNGLTHGRSGEAYILSGGYCTLKEFANTLGIVSGKKINPLLLHPVFGWVGLPFIKGMSVITKQAPLYTNEAIVAVTDGNRNISHAKAQAELNYTTRPLKDTLKVTYQWFSENGYLG